MTQRQASRLRGRPQKSVFAIAGSLALSVAFAASAFGVSPAPPPKPPLAYTGYATPVTASSATVKARVNPRGLASEYHFEYGPTVTYGSQTPSASAGSGTQEELFSATLTGLEPYTTYHYRIVANSSAGTTTGQDATFTTKKVPLSLALGATPNPVVFGSPLTVSGTLSGTGNAGVEVVLQGNSFPYTHGFHDLTSAEPTEASGGFSFPVAGLLQGTQLRAATVAKPVIYSPVFTEAVTIRVILHARSTHRQGFVRFYGVVAPSAPGAPVAIERMNSAHRYVTVSGTAVHGRNGISQFACTVRLRRRGLYRALVLSPSPGGAQISGRSEPILIR
jgi:hypothetical protein